MNENVTCPQCGSDEVTREGLYEYVCDECGTEFEDAEAKAYYTKSAVSKLASNYIESIKSSLKKTFNHGKRH